ncbi:hypothetical protein LINPERHAP1_LOCUS41065 [Linum perenne]
MGKNKATGPDGLNPGFYQHYWSLIGGEVANACINWRGSFGLGKISIVEREMKN